MSQFVEKLKVNFEFRNSLNISTATVGLRAGLDVVSKKFPPLTVNQFFRQITLKFKLNRPAVYP